MSREANYSSSAMARTRPYAITALILVAGSALSAGIFYAACAWERHSHRRVFDSLADDRFRAVVTVFDESAKLLDFADNVFMVGPKADSPEFTHYVRYLKTLLDRDLAHYPEMQGMVWAPRVSSGEQDAYETTARAVFDPTFQFVTPDSDPSADNRRNIFPSYLHLGTAPTDEQPGVDLAAAPPVWEAMQRARDTGQTIALAPSVISADANDRRGYRVLQPLYHGGAPDNLDARREAFAGFLFLNLDVGKLVDKVLDELKPAGLKVEISDDTDGKSVILSRHASRLKVSGSDEAKQADTAPFDAQQTTRFFGREVSIRCSTAPAFWAVRPLILPWVLLCGGLALTVAWTVYALGHAFRTNAIEQAVAKRMAAFQQDSDRI